MSTFNRRTLLAASAATLTATTVAGPQRPTGEFAESLSSSGPHPSLGAHADTFGRLIGDWEGEYHEFGPDGHVTSGPMELHFSWVLEGRAVQDLWISPPRRMRRANTPPSKEDIYGATVRVFDSVDTVWRVVWFDPTSRIRSDLVGRRVGDDIIQVGFYKDRPIKWTFTEIKPQSFVWSGYRLNDDGVSWLREGEYRLHRTD
jgi:hypothetical protein